jgi:hypothetical protein
MRARLIVSRGSALFGSGGSFSLTGGTLRIGVNVYKEPQEPDGERERNCGLNALRTPRCRLLLFKMGLIVSRGSALFGSGGSFSLTGGTLRIGVNERESENATQAKSNYPRPRL